MKSLDFWIPRFSGFRPSLGVYISETVHPSIRNSLVILPMCLMAFGQLMVWFLGYYVGWRITSFLVSVPLTVFFTLMYFLPETPYWLVENDQIESAKVGRNAGNLEIQKSRDFTPFPGIRLG